MLLLFCAAKGTIIFQKSNHNSRIICIFANVLRKIRNDPRGENSTME
jgi:hypothetical protein